MIQVSFTGPECSGKTTMAAALREAHPCILLEEYAREYLSTNNTGYEMKDIISIFEEHQIRYKRALEKKPELIVMDTDLLVLKIWAKYRFSYCPKSIIDAWNQISIDHYFLCAPDIPWIYDALRENPDNRLELFELYKAELIRLDRPFTILKGDFGDRLSVINSKIAALKAG
jgi:nicotinamide riboside kinase